MKIINNFIKSGLVLLALTFSACGDFFNVNPDDMLLEENNFSNLNEVYSNFLGMTTTLQKAAEQSVIMAELRGDLMEPTPNAPVEFWEAWRFEASNGNKIVDPAPFYKIVVSSNDFLRHVVAFNKTHPNTITPEVYKGMVSAALAGRAWAYLNIGKFYGEAVYYDVVFSTEVDPDKQRVMKFDELIDELIYSLKNGVDGVDAFSPIDWTKILNNSDYSWNRLSINSDILIAELYMWDGNYVEAIRELVEAVTGQGLVGVTETDNKWRLNKTYAGGNWRNIFRNTYNNIVDEAITAVPYDYSKDQTNNLQYWFSNRYPNVYYFKPSDLLIEKYEQTVRIDGGLGDVARGRFVTYTDYDGINVIDRYTAGRSSFAHDASIYIYRAAEVYLMLAEALNAVGDVATADSVLNVGLVTSWDGDAGVLLPPFNTPMFTAKNNILKNFMGVRGRAGVEPNYVKNFIPETSSIEEKQVVLDSLIAEEVGLEQAFEGKRWFTLLRMAKHKNNPAILADPISKKFPEGNREKYRTHLMNPANWFIKYDQLHLSNDK